MFDAFQGMEWVILFLIVLLIFGPSKLPQLARGLGQAVYEFRRASQGLVDETPPRGEKKEPTRNTTPAEAEKEDTEKLIKLITQRLEEHTEEAKKPLLTVEQQTRRASN